MTLSRTNEVPTFRSAQLGDLEAICDIERAQFGCLAYSHFVLRQSFELHGAYWVVAEINESLGGYAMSAPSSDNRGWVLGLAVAPALRRQHCGEQLLERVLERLREAAIREVFVTVRRDSNPAAADMYSRTGFTLSASEENYFGPGEARDVLVRRFESSGARFPDPPSLIWRKDS